MNVTKILNVTLVENHLHKLVIWGHTSKTFMKLEGQKDFKCDSCGKSFTQSSNLRTHIKTYHEGHKNFKCDSCGKLFTKADNLRRHIITLHEGHKDFRCDSCGKFFFMLVIWENTSKLFMKVTKISNVNLVKNHILKLVL